MEIAKAMIEKNTKGVDTSDVSLVPVGARVLFTLYPNNPYRKIDVSEAGVIFGLEGTKMHKSNETGEMEEDNAVIVCAHIEAVGNACKWVTAGSDVFLCKAYATPVPFRNKKMFMTDEMNVMCIIKKNE